jgi:branched-chain amino acid transport system ATP-binding protein
MGLLEIRNLEIRYGQVNAVQGVSFQVKEGSVFTVLGRNGAGKTSLLKGIAGTMRASAGQIIWRGKDITHVPPDRRVGLGITLVPEGRRIFPNLTVNENLRLGGFHLSYSEFEYALERIYQLFPFLAECSNRLGGKLSGGQQQMLAISRALITGPNLLLLDEPSFGLAPQVIEDVYAQLQTLRDDGITIVLVEQNVQRALKFADTALVLNLGLVVLQDKPHVLVQDPRLAKAYLGGIAENRLG